MAKRTKTFRALVGDTKPRIEREGGRYGAGIMRGVSLITRGEALGHDVWADETFLQQVAAAELPKGLKSRFTHPGACDDGAGKFLGRIHNLRRDGDRVLGDLHFSNSSRSAPDGDLGGYVMKLAEEDSAAAGLSIVFEFDDEATKQHFIQHGGVIEHGPDGQYLNKDKFASPDPLNTKNLPHARLKELRAADFVDEPAANPDGLFDSNPIARSADAMLAFALGVSDQRPAQAAFGVDPDRAGMFVKKFLDRHGLAVIQKDKQMSAEGNEQETVIDTTAAEAVETEPTTTPTQEVKPDDAAASFRVELGRYVARFGAENGAKWLSEGKSYPDCLEAFANDLHSQVKAERDRADAAEKKLASLELGQREPIDLGAPKGGKPKAARTFSEAVRGFQQT